ncbi:MAG: hypothetical protein WC124_08330 [Desulfoplanes sp.]
MIQDVGREEGEGRRGERRKEKGGRETGERRREKGEGRKCFETVLIPRCWGSGSFFP